MPDIKQLPPSVVNKIAAGEVIERPASIVKELVENAVDAGARRIDVSVTKGGTDVIRVTDDGCGIAAQQLPLSVASHATSKIRDADDLFQVTTMGFRGEALASIAEVSQFRMRSRPAEETAGAELEVYGGAAGKVAPCGCPVGTTVEVRNLFFSTPVRRKFLRTTQTEMSHVNEAFTRIALSHDGIHFTLSHNERTVHDLPATENWRDRIASLFGQEIAESLLFVESSESPLSISGYVANPSQNRANNRMQYLFLNRRHIRDRPLSHALSEAYRGLLMVGRYAICFLRLEMPPDAVDVNVHPTKLEVRFRDGGEVYARLLQLLRTKFLSTNLTAKVSQQEPAGTAAVSPTQAASSTPVISPTQTAAEQNAVPPFRAFDQSSSLGKVPSLPTRQDSFSLDFGQHANSAGANIHRIATPQPAKAFPPDQQTDRMMTGPSDSSAAATESPSSECEAHEFINSESMTGESMAGNLPLSESPSGEVLPSTPARVVSAEGTPAMQVYDRYLITESDEGVVVIDQHALHERILYEELREKVLSEAVEVQRLLVPEPVTLTPTEKAAVLDDKDKLSELGIEVESFGGDTVLISAYPAMLANMSPTDLLRGIVEQLMTPEKSPQRRDVIDSLLHMISCKAAIKAGDRLTADEVATLIQRRHTVQDSHHCPHGRPTTLVFSREQLDRMFGRT